MSQAHLIDRFVSCLGELRQAKLEEIAAVLAGARHIFTAGNGGSAATASHFTADLARIGLRSSCLSDNTSVITAFANDVAYDQIFALQLEIIDPADVLVVLSVSGESVNLVKALEIARRKGAMTVAFVGSGGGKLGDIAKYSIILSSDKYGEVEGTHSCLCHIIPVMIKELLP